MNKAKKEDVRITKTKAAVRHAFLKLAEEKSVSEISIKEIATEAKINRTTFYLHYKSVDDIYTDIINEHSTFCNEIISKHKDELTEFDFENCALDFIMYYDEMFGCNDKLNGGPFTLCLKRKIKDMLCEVMLDLYRNTNMRDKYIAVSDEALSGIVYGMVSIISEWIVSERKTSLKKLCKEFRDIILEGIKKL